MKLLKKINAWIESFERFAISASILLMAVICIANVLGRNLFHYSLSFAEEISQFAIVWVTFIGMSYAARLGVHIRMSALFDIMPRWARKSMMIIMTLGTGLLCLLLVKYSLDYLVKLSASGRVSPALRLPVWIVMIWVPLGFLSTGIQYFLAFYENITHSAIYISPTLTEEQDASSSDFSV